MWNVIGFFASGLGVLNIFLGALIVQLGGAAVGSIVMFTSLGWFTFAISAFGRVDRRN